MANSYAGSVWVFDTPENITAPGKAFAGSRIYILNYFWTDITTAGDQLTVLDNAGNRIIDIRAYQANYPVNGIRLGWVGGFNLTQITSGKLTVAVSAK